MAEILEAVFENGVLRPLGEVALAPGERVELTVFRRCRSRSEAEAQVREWQSVYSDFSDEEFAELERLTLDRSSFCSEETGSEGRD